MLIPCTNNATKLKETFVKRTVQLVTNDNRPYSILDGRSIVVFWLSPFILIQ